MADEIRDQDRERLDDAPGDDLDGELVRFDDPAWDDEYCTWLESGLRTCCP